MMWGFDCSVKRPLTSIPVDDIYAKLSVECLDPNISYRYFSRKLFKFDAYDSRLVGVGVGIVVDVHGHQLAVDDM